MFALTGGFRLESDDGSKPMRTFIYYHIERGDIEIPKIKEDEIQDRSKGDSIAKAVAVIQTLWFGIQAAHRVSRGFDITKLEITTLGHVALNIFVYFFWWNKPLNVRFPVEVYPKESQGMQTPSSGAPNNEGLVNNTGQEPESQMLLQPSLPFRVRIALLCKGNDEWGYLIFVSLFVSIMSSLFGAIHCLAWNSPFPTHTEHILWQICALIVTAAPTLGILGAALVPAACWRVSPTTLKQISILLGGLLVLAYSLARISLLVLSLTSLRALPYKAYENPSWSLYIPHIS